MKCPQCNTDIESGYDAYWKCGRSIYGETPVEQQKISDEDLPCLRCGTMLECLGSFDFHEGTRWGVFGSIFELLENRESFNVYVCPKCGKAEFYVPKVMTEQFI